VIDVGHVDDFPAGTPVSVSVDGRDLAIVRWEGGVYAFRDICAHMGARLSAGRVSPRFVCEDAFEPVDVDVDRPILTCPWHGYTYDLASGDTLISGRHRVRTYTASVSDEGRVLVDIARRSEG
jgi:nitrite reductase (NADH) small subunit